MWVLTCTSIVNLIERLVGHNHDDVVQPNIGNSTAEAHGNVIGLADI